MGASCWVVTDGKVGMESQCLGLAEALGLDAEIRRVVLRAPWSWLSPVPLSASPAWAISPAGDRLVPPWPDVLIASGRRSVVPSLYVGRESRGRSFRIQVQDPGIAPSRFDAVIVPAHDGLRGANVLVTSGALHRATVARLAAARRRFARLDALPRPRVAVLLGGSNDAYRFDAATAGALGDRLGRLVRAAGGSALVTTSRRTDAAAAAALRQALGEIPGEFWAGEGENPYFGFLAYADFVVVTPDSVNMVSEAVATGRPVLVAPLPGGAAKFDRFHRAMREAGYTRPLADRLDSWDYAPPDDMERIAAALRGPLAARGVMMEQPA